MAKSEFQKEIAGRLKEIRLNLKMTQEQFAELLDISIQLYKKLESGENNITNATLRKMKAKLDFSVDFLFFGEREDLEGLWNKVIALEDYDKEKLLLRLFAMMTSENRCAALKEQDKKFFEILDQVKDSMDHGSPESEKTGEKQNETWPKRVF